MSKIQRELKLVYLILHPEMSDKIISNYNFNFVIGKLLIYSLAHCFTIGVILT